jgi:formate hydrogenlyase subunit 6/NADH:ubiquinone oxidoreductase subunit I
MTIYYFTGTGNCLEIAKQLNKHLPGSTIVPIAGCVNESMFQVIHKEIVFITPLYYGGLPSIVAKFLKNMSCPQDKKIYIAVIIAAAFPWSGYALHQAKSILKKKDLAINIGIYIKTVENFLPKYKMMPIDEQNKINADVKIAVDEIAKRINNHDSYIKRETALYLYILYPSTIKYFMRQDKKYFTTEACIKCGICQRVCPVNNICIKEGKPEWQGNCEFCMACIQYCPTEAIQWGKHSGNKGRYHNPEITVKDMEEQKLVVIK